MIQLIATLWPYERRTGRTTAIQFNQKQLKEQTEKRQCCQIKNSYFLSPSFC